MRTGNMKQGIYFIIFMVLVAASATAQFTPAMISLPVANSGSIAPDIKLKVSVVKDISEVSWQGIKQLKVRRYELEKSTDGENFNYISAIPGNRISGTKYTAEDRNLNEGMNYYRLKIVDNNGNYNYSRVITLEKKANVPEIKIMPGVVADELYIWLPANTQVSKAVITDVSGRRVKEDATVTNFTNVAGVQLGRLPLGMYNINVLTNTGQTANLKFSKK